MVIYMEVLQIGGKKIGRKHFCALFLFDFAVKLFISK